jgi:hypothetical protein
MLRSWNCSGRPVQKSSEAAVMRDSNPRPLAPEGAGGYPPTGLAHFQAFHASFSPPRSSCWSTRSAGSTRSTRSSTRSSACCTSRRAPRQGRVAGLSRNQSSALSGLPAKGETMFRAGTSAGCKLMVLATRPQGAPREHLPVRSPGTGGGRRRVGELHAADARAQSLPSRSTGSIGLVCHTR